MHILDHQGAAVGDISFDGPLSFNAEGIRTDTAFDLMLPVGASTSLAESGAEKHRVQVAEQLPVQVPPRPSKASSYVSDIEYNVWASD